MIYHMMEKFSRTVDVAVRTGLLGGNGGGVPRPVGTVFLGDMFPPERLILG
jgi:nicotinamide mononucleotide (NMN) deamidase PncC